MDNEKWWIVLTPTPMRELLGRLMDADGAPKHLLMGPMEESLVRSLAEHAWGLDPTVDISVAHGWEQAPEGMQETYERKREELSAAVRKRVDDGLAEVNERFAGERPE